MHQTHLEMRRKYNHAKIGKICCKHRFGRQGRPTPTRPVPTNKNKNCPRQCQRQAKSQAKASTAPPMRGRNYGTPTQSTTSNKQKYKIISKIMSHKHTPPKQNSDPVAKTKEFKPQISECASCNSSSQPNLINYFTTSAKGHCI